MYNGVVPKPKPNTTMPLLLNNIIIKANFHLQTTHYNMAETELQTFKLPNSQMRNRFRFEARVICKSTLYIRILSLGGLNNGMSRM